MPLATVRENKLGLILGWIDTGLFGIVFCGCIITLLVDIVSSATDDVCSKLALLIIGMPLLIIFTVCKIPLIVSYHKRALLFYDDYIAYTTFFGKTRTFAYSEIQSVQLKSGNLYLYSHDHKKLAVIEDTMENYRETLSILRKRNFKIVEEKKFFRIFRWMRVTFYIVILQAIQYFVYFAFCYWYFYASFPVV